MEWLTSNWQLLVSVLFALLTLASLITKFTKTPKDDEIVRKIISWLSFLQPSGLGGLKLPGTPARSEGDVPFENLRDE